VQVSAGVGLNTRVGTASFISSLSSRFPGDLRPFCPKLIQALSEAARVEGSKAVRKAYAAALANVGKCAAEKRLGRLVEDTVRSRGAVWFQARGSEGVKKHSLKRFT
jgi:hypothetical protein